MYSRKGVPELPKGKANNRVQNRRPAWTDISPVQTMRMSYKELEDHGRFHDSQRLVDSRDIEASRAKLAVHWPALAGFIAELESLFGPVTGRVRRNDGM